MNPYPKEVGENPIFIFNHIPKCGGTSLNIVLRKWFHVIKDYYPHEMKYKNEEDLIDIYRVFCQNSPRLGEVKPWQIIAGHYHKDEILLNIRFSLNHNNSKIHMVTFVRDPFEHRVSRYSYGRGFKEYVKGLTFKEFLKKEKNFFAKNLNCTQDNYKEVMDKYFFIGVTENFNDSISMLCKKIGKQPLRQVPFVNKGDKKLKYSLSELEFAEFYSDNLLDYQIYEYAKELLKKSI